MEDKSGVGVWLGVCEEVSSGDKDHRGSRVCVDLSEVELQGSSQYKDLVT